MIISIAIFAVMGGLLILVGTHIDATNRATNVLKNKVSGESPYAANQIPTYLNEQGTTVELPSENVEIVIKVDTNSETIGATKYGTENVITDGLSPADKAAVQKKANGSLNLQFIEVPQPTSTAATTTGAGGTTTATTTTTAVTT